jgi:glucose-1-phosphate cytidylyltransferase
MAFTEKLSDTPEVVILCGGRGTRLGEETKVLPKPLVEVGGRPILWHIMDHYARAGFKKFVLCLGYKGGMIRDYFLNYHVHNNDFTLNLNGKEVQVTPHLDDVVDWQVTCAETGSDAQTGARISRVSKYIKSPYFLCTYGDGICDVDLHDLIRFHKAHGKAATLTGVHPPARFGELMLKEGAQVTRFSEKPQMGEGYVNGGFFVFNREVFDYVTDDDDCILERAPMERLAADDQLRVYKHHGFWRCMDTPKDRDELDTLLSGGGFPQRVVRNGNGTAHTSVAETVPG